MGIVDGVDEDTSARVGSPIRSCQRSTGIELVNRRTAAAVAVLDDLEHLVTLLRSEWLTPIVEDQQLEPPSARISRG